MSIDKNWMIGYDAIPFMNNKVCVCVCTCVCVLFIIIIHVYIRLEGLHGASQVALVVKNSPANAGDIRDRGWFSHWVMKIWRRAWQPTLVFLPAEPHG